MIIKKFIPIMLASSVSGGALAQESEPTEAQDGAQDAIPEVQVV